MGPTWHLPSGTGWKHCVFRHETNYTVDEILFKTNFFESCTSDKPKIVCEELKAESKEFEVEPTPVEESTEESGLDYAVLKYKRPR